MGLAYNIFFSIDLLITLKYPLFSGRKRNIFYHLSAIALTLLTYLIIFAQGFQKQYKNCIDFDNNMNQDNYI